MPNIEALIRNNNSRVFKDNKSTDVSADTCNCPLDGKCLTSSIVYKATIKKASGNVSYLAVSERPFKERYITTPMCSATESTRRTLSFLS